MMSIQNYLDILKIGAYAAMATVVLAVVILIKLNNMDQRRRLEAEAVHHHLRELARWFASRDNV